MLLEFAEVRARWAAVGQPDRLAELTDHEKAELAHDILWQRTRDTMRNRIKNSTHTLKAVEACINGGMLQGGDGEDKENTGQSHPRPTPSPTPVPPPAEVNRAIEKCAHVTDADVARLIASYLANTGHGADLYVCASCGARDPRRSYQRVD